MSNASSNTKSSLFLALAEYCFAFAPSLAQALRDQSGNMSPISLDDKSGDMFENRIAGRRGKKGGLESFDFDDDEDETTVMSLTAGFLPANRIYDALKKARHLHLSRVQLLAVMSLANVDESSIEEVPYRIFAGTAAQMITKFYDPREIKRRALLEKKTDMNPLKLLNGVTKEDITRQLDAQLLKIDPKRRGNVSEEAFKKAVKHCLEKVNLTKSELMACIASAPRNSTGRIVYKSFISAIYDQVLHMKTERILFNGEQHDREGSVDGGLAFDQQLLVPPSKNDLEKLTKALYSQVNLESRRGSLKVHFSEDSNVSISMDESGSVSMRSVSSGGSGTVLEESSSNNKTRRNSNKELLHTSKRSQFTEEQFVDEEKTCPVVDSDGNRLDQFGKPFFPTTGAVAQSMKLRVKIHTINEPDGEFQRIRIQGFSVTKKSNEGGALQLEKTFNLPSLALADDEAARSFACNIADNLKIVILESGERTFLM